MMPPDEVSGAEAWRVFDKANPKVPDDIADTDVTECWAWD